MIPLLQHIVSEVAAFQSNRGRKHLVTANNHADNVIAYSGQLPLVASIQPLEEAQTTLATIRKQSEQATVALSNQEHQLREEFTRLTQQMEATTKEITTQKGRLDSAITEYQKQFSNSESTRHERFSQGESARQSQFTEGQKTQNDRLAQVLTDAQKRTQDSIDDAKTRLANMLEEASKKANEQNAEFSTQGTDVLRELELFRGKAVNLMHVIGSTGMAGEYQKTANSARRGNIIWQVIAGSSLLGLIIFAMFTYLATQTAEIIWGVVAARLFVTMTFGILAAYAARQSDRYAETEVRNRGYQLELSSIDPYLANLPEDIQQKVKVELAQKLFGNAAATTVSTSSKFSGTGKDPLELTLSIIAGFTKK